MEPANFRNGVFSVRTSFCSAGADSPRRLNLAWAGFDQNMRVLKWILDRVHGRAGAQETPLGWVPRPQDFDLEGMENFSAQDFQKAQAINIEEWRREILSQDEFFMKIYAFIPKEMIFQRELLVARL